MSSRVGPSPDEVVAALVNMAFIALVLAAVVLATRKAQVSMDRRQAVRARLEAIESSKQRLRTLVDRNRLYQTETVMYAVPVAASPADGAAAFASPSSARQWCDHPGDSRGPSLDGGQRGHSIAVGSGTPCAMAPVVAGGGTVSSLAAAASALMHSCTISAKCTSSTSSSSCTASGISDAATTASSGNSSTRSSTSNSTAHPALAHRALDRSRSLNFQYHQQHQHQQREQQQQQEQHRWQQGPLQHKGSDSLLETCRVLASVPPTTITSTRQVLAAFNYDYSALRRRESSYVTGTSSWRARKGM